MLTALIDVDVPVRWFGFAAVKAAITVQWREWGRGNKSTSKVLVTCGGGRGSSNRESNAVREKLTNCRGGGGAEAEAGEGVGKLEEQRG